MAEFLVVARANINLVHGVTTPEHIRVEQYDGNWDKQLQLTLYDEADLYPIPIEVASIVISGTKRDGTGFSYFCTWDGATVYAPLMQQMTLFDGNVPVNITLFDDDNNQLSSAMFVLDVEAAALPATVLESSNDFRTFIDYVNTAEYYKILSQSYAVGNTGIRTEENTDNAEYYWRQSKIFKGSPLVASTVAGMTDTSHVYVYVGSETGMTSGNWYYWDGSAWVSGGVYNAQGVQTDDTLSVQGTAADAKATGDAIASVEANVTALTASDAKAYKIDDSIESTIDAADYLPFYDSSASAKKRILMSNFSTGGSTITVRTSESDLYGKSVTITDGGTTLTRTFSNTGVAIFSGVTLTGSLTVSATGTSQTATKTINVQYYSAYTVILAFWSATISITADEAFYEATVTVKNSNNTTVGTVTLSDSGTGTFTALYADTYTLTATYNGDDYVESVVVTSQTTYNVEFNSFIVYGFHIDGSESDPNSNITYQVQYDGSNVKNYNYTPAHFDFSGGVMNPGSWNLANDFFIPRSCMLKYDGTVDYYLDEDDETLKADGTTASDVADTSYGGNCMMEWGRNGQQIWIKIVPDTNDVYSATVYVANTQLDEDFHAYAFMDADGNLTEHCYSSKYAGSNISSKLRSISGVSPAAIGGTYAKTYALANNTGDDIEWYTDVYCDRVMINILLMMIGRSTDTQSTFGYGHCYGVSSTAGLLACGSMNGKGMWYGTTDTSKGVKVFGMEHYWGNQHSRVAGLLYGGGSQYYCMNGTYSNGSPSSDYSSVSSGGISLNQNSYIAKMIWNADGFFPKVLSATSTTYYCDGITTGSASTTWYYAVMGGSGGHQMNCGAFYYNLGYDISATAWAINDRLTCKPLAT